MFGSEDVVSGTEIEFWYEGKPETWISECLPASLRILGIVDAANIGMSDESVVLWDFAGDLAKLPLLESVPVQCGDVWVDSEGEEHWLDWSKLIAFVKQNGVCLKKT